MDRLEMVSDKSFSNRFDNWNPAGHRRLEKNRDPNFSGELEDLGALFGQQRFVASHDRFSCIERSAKKFVRKVNTADQFNDDADRRIIDERFPAFGENFLRRPYAADLQEVAYRDPTHL